MRVNQRITIAAGTPVRLAAVSTWVRSLSLQMQVGGSGYGIVLDLSAPNLQAATPDATNGDHVCWQLAPASPTAPGGQSGYPDTDRGYDIQWIYVDGSNTGDTVAVSYDKKV